MKRFLLVAGVFVLCLPLFFACWLLLAVHWGSMDASTMRMPAELRKAVAQAVVKETSNPAVDEVHARRAEKLYPNDPGIEAQACTDLSQSKDGIAACQLAVKLDDSWENWAHLAHVLDHTGDPCSAAKAYKQESDRSGGEAYSAQSWGIKSLQCGNFADALAGFQLSVQRNEASLQQETDRGPDAEESMEIQTDLEWMSLVYKRMGKPKEALAACLKANPNWKNCDCNPGKDDAIDCTTTGEAKNQPPGK